MKLTILIPAHGIGISQAHERLAELFEAHPEILPTLDEDYEELLAESRKVERSQQPADAYGNEEEEFLDARRRANLFLRAQLDDGLIKAYVRDEKAGQDLTLPAEEWVSTNWNDYVPWGIWDDFIDAKDYESPGPRISGPRRPVYLVLTEFERWLSENFAPKIKRGRGRPLGSAPLLETDKPFVKEMRRLVIEAGMLKTLAARLLAPNVVGQSKEANVRRLLRRYEDEYLSL